MVYLSYYIIVIMGHTFQPCRTS